MTRRDAIAELIAKVEARSLVQPFLFQDVFNNQDAHKNCAGEAYEAYGGSLDAAKALHDAVLPKMYWNISEWDGAWTCQLPISTFKRYEATSDASPARAWLLAILRALHAQEQA
jgi:hypothetical protein